MANGQALIAGPQPRGISSPCQKATAATNQEATASLRQEAAATKKGNSSARKMPLPHRVESFASETRELSQSYLENIGLKRLNLKPYTGERSGQYSVKAFPKKLFMCVLSKDPIRRLGQPQINKPSAYNRK